MVAGKRKHSVFEKAFSALCAACVALGSVPLAAHAAPSEEEVRGTVAQGAPGSFVEDEIIVVFDEAPSGENALYSRSMRPNSPRASEGEGDAACEPLAQGRAVVVGVDEGSTIEEAIRAAEQVPGVAYAQPNYRYYLPENAASAAAGADAAAGEQARSACSQDAACVLSRAAIADGAGLLPRFAIDDPFASEEYFLSSWESSFGVDAYGAWDIARAEGSVTIAVLDTGIRVDHEDLRDNILTEYMKDVYMDTAPGTMTSSAVPTGDNCGHGTHVAGVAAASANNAVGIAGASFNAKILPLKVFANASENPSCRTSDLVKAYDYLLDLVDAGSVDDLHVVNLSLGSYGAADEVDRLLEERIETAASSYDIITVAAGGNGDERGEPITAPSYPSDFDAVVSVTATNRDGANIRWSDYNEFKDISAPGATILSTYHTDGRSYSYLSGTSMAAPLVSGIAALLWALDPGLTVDDAKAALYETANPIDPSSPHYRSAAETGSCGVVDARDAVAYVGQHAGAGRDDISACTLSAIPDQTFTGFAVEPSQHVVVKDGARVLVQGVDYDVAYENNVHVGEATAVIRGTGSYRGSLSTSFRIVPAPLSEASVATERAMICVGDDPATIGIALFMGDVRLEKDRDYTVSFDAFGEPGYAVARIEGMGDVEGERDVRFRVVTAEPFSFADVASDDWFAPWTVQASSLGIVSGHQDGNGQLTGMFGPNEPLTRAQAALMLARAAGVDLPTGPVASNGAFEDNLDGRYYTAAINWASEAGILRGDDPDRTKVRPSAPVSRAELAVMMARFAAFFSVDTSAASPDAFYQCLDYRDVPDWAAPAMVWAAANGIITGYPAPGGSELRCYDTVTRAQTAKVTVRSAETVFGIPALSQ